MKIRECQQCYKPFATKRAHAKYCSNACRKQASRGVEPEAWYYRTDQAHVEARRTEFLTAIAQSNPTAFHHLEQLKAFHGVKALNSALTAIMNIVDEQNR